MSGLVDSSPPGGSIVPYRNFTPPPETPDKLAVSVTPGSRDQYAIDSDKRPMPPPGPYLDTNGQLVQPTPEQVAALPTPTGQPRSDGPANPIKDAVRDEWLAAGYPPAAVEGIMRRVGVESGWNVHAVGDGGTSFSLYQHHADRAQRLAQYLENTKVDQKDPVALARATTKFAISEMNGGDSIAAKAKPALMNPNITPQDAYGTFTSSFERPVGSPGSEETNLRSNALGSFNAGASAYLQTWQQDIQKRSKEYDDALAEGKDLRKAARAAMAKWELDSEHPPKDMRENWNQWAGAAIGLAMLGGFFGKNHTAAINAAGEMLQAANAADVRAYDIAYKKWKDHNDSGLKLIELLHGEARDIVEDARKSYDQKVTELGTLSTAYQLQQHLDPTSIENIEKKLRVQQLTTSITEAQHDNAKKAREEKEIADSVAQKDKALETREGRPVTAAEHNQHIGDAKREGSGTAGAAADAIKAQVYSNTLAAEISRWVAVNPGKTEADIPPEDYAAMQQRAASVSGYTRGGTTRDHEYQVIDKDGKVVDTLTLDKRSDGFYRSDTGKKVDPPEGGKILPTTPSAGKQASQTVQAITGAASELTRDLQNAMHLPIASRMSVFMGVENQTPGTLTEALQHTLTRETVTENDSIKMNIVFTGIQRSLGILENQGRATGIVGLSDSNKMLIPQKGWTADNVLMSYAQMRQVGEQDLEAYMNSPNSSKEQREYMQVLRDRLAAAVPFTVQDVLALDPAKKESVAEFADKVLGAKKDDTALPAAARSQLQEGVNTTFGNGQVWTLKNGQPEQIK